MTLKITPNRITASNALGQNVLDSNDRQFHRLDYHSGSVVLPARTRGSDVTIERTLVIGACDPAATAVFGAIRGNSASAGIIGHQPGDWAAAGGTYIHAFDGLSPFDLRARISVLQALTIRCSGGQLLLDECVYACRDPGAYATNLFIAIEAVTFEWRVWSGTFDN